VAEPGIGGAGLSDRSGGASWDTYSARWAASHDGLDPRHSRIWVRVWLRWSYRIARGLARLHVPPNAVTLVGLLLSIAVPAVVVLGGWWLFVAAGLVILAGLADSVDGAIAFSTTRSTRLGAFYDAMADRLGEAAWLVALWLLGAPGILVGITGGLVFLHEYARAQAGASAKGGPVAMTLAERALRVLLTTAALVAGGLTLSVSPHLSAGAVTIVLALWAALTLLALPRLLGSVRIALRAPVTRSAGSDRSGGPDRSAGPDQGKRSAENREWAWVARESEVPKHVHEAEPAVEPPRA
jgi:phosphatidylglycerophosphate synthase